jgi:hypothetical protein
VNKKYDFIVLIWTLLIFDVFMIPAFPYFSQIKNTAGEVERQKREIETFLQDEAGCLERRRGPFPLHHPVIVKRRPVLDLA